MTVSETEVVRVSPLPEPLTVMVYVPAAVVEPAVRVKVELPEPGAARDDGLKVAVTPAGVPEADNATADEKLPLIEEVTPTDPLAPCATESVVGDAASEKFAATGVLTV